MNVRERRTPRNRQPFRRSGQGAGQPARRSVPAWALLALLLLATFFVYQPAWRGGLLWDDDGHMTRSDLQSVDGLRRIWFDLGATQQYYPLVHSAFWLFHAWWGDSTPGYHLASIVLHALSAFLLGLILRRLAVPWPWLAAAVFALHPVHVESVAWISELKNTLSGALFLASMLAYLDFDRTRRIRSYGLAFGFFALALLSKTVTVTLPVLALVACWWQRGHLSPRRDALPLVPFVLLAVPLGWLTAWTEHALIGARGATFDLTLIERCLVAGRAIVFYLGKVLWPADLAFIYPRWQVSGGVWWQYLYPLGVAALLGGLWWWRTRERGPLAAFLVFCAALAPALGFINVYPFRYSFVADHFQYLASIGIITLVTGAMGRAAARWSHAPRWLPAAVAVALVVPLAVAARDRSRDFSGAEALYRATIATAPSSWMARNNLAVLLLDRSTDEAVAQLQAALRDNPDYPEAHNNLGLALQLLGRFEDAAAAHAAALRLEPSFAEAHNNLGTAMQKLGRHQEAAAAYREAIRLRPLNPPGYANLGNALLQMGRFGEAIPAYTEAIRLDPTLANVHHNLGVALERVGRHEEAVAEYRAAIRIEPRAADAHANAGALLARLGRAGEAVAHYEALVRIQPDSAQACLDLGNALYAAGDWSRAAAAYDEARRIDPRSAAAHNNLGACLERLGRLDEAAAHYEEAARIQPDAAGTRANLLRIAALKRQRLPR